MRNTKTLGQIVRSPLHHLDVEAEAFVDWIRLPSNAWAQPEHLWGASDYAVLSERPATHTHKQDAKVLCWQ